MTLSVVVLPQPDGPSSTMKSVSRISRSSRSTAVTLPYRFVIRRQSILAMPTLLKCLSFDRAGGESGDDVALEQHRQHDRRHDRDHAGRIDEGKADREV